MSVNDNEAPPAPLFAIHGDKYIPDCGKGDRSTLM
jgi:hypothetical protein